MSEGQVVAIGPGVVIRHMGSLEVARLGRGARWVDGWAVWVDGRERQPWMQRREATREARAVVKERTTKGVAGG